jgi:hypothetical protein
MPTLIADLFVRNPVDRDDQLSFALALAIYAASDAKDRASSSRGTTTAATPSHCPRQFHTGRPASSTYCRNPRAA